MSDGRERWGKNESKRTKKRKQVDREPILSFTRSTDSFIQLFQEHVIIYDIYKKDKNAKNERSKEWLLIIEHFYVYIMCYIKHFESPWSLKRKKDTMIISVKFGTNLEKYI